MFLVVLFCFIFFFNDTATTEIYTYCHTLSLHDALPILILRRDTDGRGASPCRNGGVRASRKSADMAPIRTACADRTALFPKRAADRRRRALGRQPPDRKSTRLNSSH